MLVSGQQPQVVGPISEPQGKGHLAAVHHAGVHEGCKRINLVADFVPVFRARRGRAEERDAVSLVLDAGVVGWDLE